MHEIQLESINLQRRKDTSCTSQKNGSKYGSTNTIITEATKICPWIGQDIVYNCLKAIKKRKAKTVLKEAAANSQVLQVATSINQQHINDDASWKPGQPNGSTYMAELNLSEKRKSGINVVATRYFQDKEIGGKVPV